MTIITIWADNLPLYRKRHFLQNLRQPQKHAPILLPLHPQAPARALVLSLHLHRYLLPKIIKTRICQVH
jgi:hypothetical protein